MHCEHFADGNCRVASGMADDQVPIEAAACEACAREPQPRAINRVTVGVAIAAVKRAGNSPHNLLAQHAALLQVKRPFPLRVVSYAAAVARWIREGRPVRSEAEVLRLYREKCGPCPLRQPTSQPEVSYCGACGCVLSTDPSVANKLFFATESCPEKLF